MCAIHITRSYWLTILLFLPVLHLVRSQDTVTVTTVDDRDPAIKFHGVWARIPLPGKPNPGDPSYNETSTLSRAGGATATFKFNGTRVSVFGTQGPNDPENTTMSTYSIDNSSPSQYNIPSDLKTSQFRFKFYSSPPLDEGEHTLIITNLNDNAWYWLDYIEVTSPVGALPPTSNSSDKTSDPTSTPSPTPTPAAGNTQQSKTGISKGAIAGIALGISALVVLLLLAALLWRRRHMKPTKLDSTADLPEPLEGNMMRESAILEPYQVEQFASLTNVPTSSNRLNEKRTNNGVAPIRSTENNVNFSQSLVNGHASDSATTQYSTSAGVDGTSEITPSVPSMSRPRSSSKLRPPYPGAASGNTGTSSPVAQTAPSMPTSSSPSQSPSPNGRSMDGGIRIAGGPPSTTREEKIGEIIDTDTLPPAYGTYGDT